MHASSGVFLFLFQFYQLQKFFNFQLIDFYSDHIAMAAASYTYMVPTKNENKNNKSYFLQIFPR